MKTDHLQETHIRWLSPKDAAAYLGLPEAVLAEWAARSIEEQRVVYIPFKTLNNKGRFYRVYNIQGLEAFISSSYQDPLKKRNESDSHMTFSGTSPTKGGAK